MEIERNDFVGAVSRLGDSVYSFHDRFGIPTVDSSDRDDTLETLRRRLALLSEEVGEHARELNRANVEDATSEAIDIAYVALGTVLTLGQAGRDACYAISDKNDAKTLSTHGNRGSTGKVVAR
jgi:NTP pyrophosphatase (non-canonical NTP hydrolase)